MRIKGFMPFLRVKLKKANVIAQLEYGLVYYNILVQYVSHYTTEIHSYLDDMCITEDIDIFKVTV